MYWPYMQRTKKILVEGSGDHKTMSPKCRFEQEHDPVIRLRGGDDASLVSCITEATGVAREDGDTLELIEDLKAENETLHKLMADVLEMANSMNGGMEEFVRSHEAMAREYNEKIGALKRDDTDPEATIERLTTALDDLREEDDVLKRAVWTRGTTR